MRKLSSRHHYVLRITEALPRLETVKRKTQRIKLQAQSEVVDMRELSIQYHYVLRFTFYALLKRYRSQKP
jgi:hypothetical protein